MERLRKAAAGAKNHDGVPSVFSANDAYSHTSELSAKELLELSSDSNDFLVACGSATDLDVGGNNSVRATGSVSVCDQSGKHDSRNQQHGFDASGRANNMAMDVSQLQDELNQVQQFRYEQNGFDDCSDDDESSSDEHIDEDAWYAPRNYFIHNGMRYDGDLFQLRGPEERSISSRPNRVLEHVPGLLPHRQAFNRVYSEATYSMRPASLRARPLSIMSDRTSVSSATVLEDAVGSSNAADVAVNTAADISPECPPSPLCDVIWRRKQQDQQHDQGWRFADQQAWRPMHEEIIPRRPLGCLPVTPRRKYPAQGKTKRLIVEDNGSENFNVGQDSARNDLKVANRANTTDVKLRKYTYARDDKEPRSLLWRRKRTLLRR